MRFNAYNETLIDRLLASVKDFIEGRLAIDEVQSALASTMTLLENDGSGAAELVRAAEADVEEIRFTRSHGDQGAELLRRLQQLVDSLAAD